MTPSTTFGIGSIVCTLFEGDYHFGLGALSNSLYRNGFRGIIVAGFRGDKPQWAAKDPRNSAEMDFEFAPGARIRFVPVLTSRHLTNFKPEFLLQTLESLTCTPELLFYFDPDIVIKCRWGFFEEWARGGVALCEDVNSPMPHTHPIRHAWRNYFSQFGRQFHGVSDFYVNGGFIGLHRDCFEFLRDWQEIQLEIAPAAGGLTGWLLQDRTFPFSCTDQDALNVTLMQTKLSVSLVAKDGMDIDKAGFIMSHSLGRSKPWNCAYVGSVIRKGKSPPLSHKNFWRYSRFPIALFNPVVLQLRLFDLKLAGFLARFLARSSSGS